MGDGWLDDVYVSRDANGYVGETYRNKSVGELRDFKKTMKESVTKHLDSVKMKPTNFNTWNSFVTEALEKVKQTGGRL